MKEGKLKYSWLALRIALGFMLIWAFLDKLFGLGFSTCRDRATQEITFLCKNAWVSGGSPTAGFLMSSSNGPLGPFFQNLSGSVAVDILFMAGLIGIGIALILGFARKPSGYLGALLMILIYLAHFVPSNNPIIDEHIIYASVFMMIALSREAYEDFSLEKYWKKIPVVKKFKWLE